VASLSQGRTAAAQCGLFTHKSVPVIFEPPCISVSKCFSMLSNILDSVVSYLPTGPHLGFFRSWPSLFLPSRKVKERKKKDKIFPDNAMRAYRGNRGMALLILNFSTWWRWVVNFRPWPLYWWEGTPVAIQ